MCPVLSIRVYCLLYPLLALVVSAILSSQYTEFHLEYVDYDLCTILHLLRPPQDFLIGSLELECKSETEDHA
jgi:hypothetical protein